MESTIMGYEQSVLQRRLCTNIPSAHLQWLVQGYANDPMVVQCPSHHLYYLSSKKILIFKVVCRHSSCIPNASAVCCCSRAQRVFNLVDIPTGAPEPQLPCALPELASGPAKC